LKRSIANGADEPRIGSAKRIRFDGQTVGVLCEQDSRPGLRGNERDLCSGYRNPGVVAHFDHKSEILVFLNDPVVPFQNRNTQRRVLREDRQAHPARLEKSHKQDKHTGNERAAPSNRPQTANWEESRLTTHGISVAELAILRG